MRGMSTPEKEGHLNSSDRQDFAVRQDERREANFTTTLSCRGAFQKVTIRDVSKSGAKIADTYGLFPGDQVRLRMPDRKKIRGKIVWSLGSVCGVVFDEPFEDWAHCDLLIAAA